MGYPVSISFEGRICRVTVLRNKSAEVTYWAVAQRGNPTDLTTRLLLKLGILNLGPIVFIGGIRTTDPSFVEDKPENSQISQETDPALAALVGGIARDLDIDLDEFKHSGGISIEEIAEQIDDPGIDQNEDFMQITDPPNAVIDILEERGYEYAGIDAARVDENPLVTQQRILDAVFDSIPPRLTPHKDWQCLLSVKTDWAPTPSDAPLELESRDQHDPEPDKDNPELNAGPSQ